VAADHLDTAIRKKLVVDAVPGGVVLLLLFSSCIPGHSSLNQVRLFSNSQLIASIGTTTDDNFSMLINWYYH
jgi:hypothetical protein